MEMRPRLGTKEQDQSSANYQRGSTWDLETVLGVPVTGKLHLSVPQFPRL